MHPAAHAFVAAQVAALGPFRSVIEIGSRDINGTVRDLFAGAQTYVGLDLHEGPGVDWVGDARTYRPERQVAAVVCCEVLEHAAGWAALVAAAALWLEPGGVLIVTCAGPGRRPHSAIDGGWELHPGEHYGNVSADDLGVAMRSAGLRPQTLVHHRRDTQAVGVKA